MRRLYTFTGVFLAAVALSCAVSAQPAELLPAHKAFLEENKWTVIRLPRGDRKEYGSCSYYEKIIRLYVDRPATYFHEVGHAISRSNWYGTYFQRLYEDENISSENVSEFFAWAFSKYYTNNLYLQIHCPETYTMLKYGFFSNDGQVNHEFLSCGGVKPC